MNLSWKCEAWDKGFVAITFNLRFNTPDRYKYTARARAGFPYKLSALHYCATDSKMFRPHAAGCHLFLAGYARLRFRTHYGDPEEIKFKLQTYGIPVTDMGDFPFQADGSFSHDWFHSWLKTRRRLEETGGAAPIDLITPRRSDVLFGRGRNTRCHAGNLRALHLVESLHEEYEASAKLEKTAFAERIVNEIYESQGRFLKWEGDNGWVEVNRDVAREKISHLFRNVRSRKTSTTKEKDGAAKEKRKWLSTPLGAFAAGKYRCRE